MIVSLSTMDSINFYQKPLQQKIQLATCKPIMSKTSETWWKEFRHSLTVYPNVFAQAGAISTGLLTDLTFPDSLSASSLTLISRER